MNAFALSGLILGLTCTSLALLVNVYGKMKLHRAWALFNFSVAIWGFGAFSIGLAETPPLAVLSWKLAHIGGIFIPVCFFHTICIFCEIDGKRKNIIRFAYLQGMAFLILDIAGFLIKNVRFAFDSIYYNYPVGWVYSVFFAIWIGLVFWGHVELIVYFRQSTGLKRNQSIYFFIGMSVGFLGGSTNFLPMFGINVYPFGNFTIPVYCLISTYAILRYRLMDIHLVFRRGMGYSLAAGLVTSLFIVMVLSLSRLLSNFTGISSFAITVVSALIVAMLFHPLKNKVQSFIDKNFFKSSYDYYPVIRKISRRLTSLFDMDELFQYIGQSLGTILGLHSLYIFRLVPDKGYGLVYQYEDGNGYGKETLTDSSHQNDTIIQSRSELVQYLGHTEEILVKNELPAFEKDIGKIMRKRIEEELTSLSGEMVVPVFVDRELNSIVILGEKKSRDMFTIEDINLLGIIANQLAISIKNAELYRDKIHSERLASIGMMSATFAHEIRNPLTSLKTFAQLMPEKYEDEEFRDTFSRIVVGEIERIDGLIKDLLDFSSNRKSTRMNNLDLVSLLGETLSYVERKMEVDSSNIDVKRVFNAEQLLIAGDGEKLKQTFINLMMNACQAMHGEGTLSVTLNCNSDNVDVSVSDTGEGIPADDIEKIFDPFVTTKEMGVGLGLAISRRVVEDHNGKITVNSVVSEGTTFTVTLPVQNT